MIRYTLVAVSIMLMMSSASVSAQPAPPPPPAAPMAPAAVDGPRFRWGISAGGGLETFDVVSGPMFGLDTRLGLQLNDLLGFYAQAHLSLGSLSTEAGGGGLAGFTGTFTAAGIAEATFMDRFFVGAGAGFGMLNNPSGFMFQARAGGYPLVTRARDGVRRKGLMLGVDLRTIFVTGGTGILVLGSIGYEAF